MYSHFYKNEINDENLVCGIPKSDMIGKNANEIDKKYNVVLEKYDENGKLVGIIYDVTFKYFMIKEYGSPNNYDFAYAEVDSNGKISDLRVFDSTLTNEDLQKLLFGLLENVKARARYV